MQDGADIEFVNNEDTGTFKAIIYRKNISGEDVCMDGGRIIYGGGQKTNGGGQKTDGGGQKTNEGGQKTDGGGQKSINIILELIAQNPKISRKELSDSIGISQSAIQKHIENLKAKGLIKRVGPAKGGYWLVLQTNEHCN